ncbi:hypothetical protein BH20ACT6_BH20ACT6_08090 [soil metagenome]
MIPAVAYAFMLVAAVGALWSAVLFARDRRLNDALVWTLAALEVGLLLQLVAGSVALVLTERDVDGPLFIGYLLTAVLVLPAGVAWAASEKTRWGVGVLFVACITVAALADRLLQVWQV